MKKTFTLFIVLGFVGCLCLSLAGQDQQTQTDKELFKPVSEQWTFESAGRRDPFKDLLAGKDSKDKSVSGGVPQMYIEEVALVGIVKSRQKLTAIVSGPQGFPYFVKVGDKFSDGYVLSISDYQVVFRKTNERGIPLMRPKDIIKEINTEER